MMQQDPDGSGSHNDLEFNTSIDNSVQQNVSYPAPSPAGVPPPTNNTLSNMLAAASPPSISSPMSPPQLSSSSSSPSASSILTSLPQAVLTHSSHPTACLFHVLFKSLAFALYLLGDKFKMEGILVTVLCILLLAADFWVVKNITGRLLVGLRWWNKVDPVTGATKWIFESANDETTTTDAAPMVAMGAAPSYSSSSVRSNFDYNFFWSVLYITPLLWGVSAIAALLWLRFQCMVTISCALALSLSNVYGYYKCSADQKAKLTQWMNRGAQFGASTLWKHNFFGYFGRSSTAGRMQPVPQQDIMPGTFA